MTTIVRSPIHFSGNKKKALAKGLKELVTPKGDGLLFDMMVGGGAVLYNCGPRGSMGFDNDHRLIYLHEHFVKSKALVPLLKHYYQEYFGGVADKEKRFYDLRADFNRLDSGRNYSVPWAARLVLLTQMSFNSLWRFSDKSGYNAPYGHGKKEFDITRVIEARNLAKSRGFVFQHRRMRDIGEIDVVGMQQSDEDVWYYDPPYLTSRHQYAGWTIRDEWELRMKLENHIDQGRKFVLSNVAMYRGVVNHSLLDWAELAELNVYVIGKMKYSAWSQAVKSVNAQGGTIEIAVTNIKTNKLKVLE